MSRLSTILRIAVITIWLGAIVFCIGTYLLYPLEFTAERIAAFLREFHTGIWLIYLSISVLRGFTLLPSTPLVIAGTLLFPSQPFAVLIVSIVGILISSSIIYLFSDFLGFADFFESRKPEMIHKIRAKLEKPSGVVFVALWAFFPFVPTDMVCYAAGTTKMNYFKFIGAVFIGELILCSVYVFGGGYLRYLVG